MPAPRNHRHKFMMKYGTADHIHQVLDVIDPDMHTAHTLKDALGRNPNYNRSHVDKMLAHPNERVRQAAFDLGHHITDEDMTKHVVEPSMRVRGAVLENSWNPAHFEAFIRHPKVSGTNAKWALRMAGDKGILTTAMGDAALQHPDPDVRDAGIQHALYMRTK
jgi:hypothetical protein